MKRDSLRLWATGKIARSERTKNFLNIAEDEEIIGVVRVGYPNAGESTEKWREERDPVASKLNWHQA